MAPRNLMLDFMQGYQFGDNIDRADRAEARQVDATKRTNELQDRQVAKYDKDLGDQTALRGLNAARYEVATQGGISPETFAKFSPEFQANFKASTPEVQQKISARVQNPQRISEELDLWDGISGVLDQGKLPDGEMVKRYLNSAGKEELHLRGGDDGLERSVFGVVPSPDGSGLMFDLKVTGKDGKSYNAPATEKGLTSGNGDDTVAKFPIPKVIAWGGDIAALNKMIEAEMIARGDTTVLASLQKRQEAAAKRITDINDYETKKAIDQKYAPEKDNWIANSRYGNTNLKTGEKIVGAAGGLSETWTDDNGDEHTVPSAGAARVQARNDKMAAARDAAVTKAMGAASSQIEKLDLTTADPLAVEIATSLAEKRVNSGDPRSLSGVTIGGASYRDAKKWIGEAQVTAKKEAEQKRTDRGVMEFDKTTFGGDPNTWIENRTREITLGRLEALAPAGAVGSATMSWKEGAQLVNAMPSGPEKTEAARQFEEQKAKGAKDVTINLQPAAAPTTSPAAGGLGDDYKNAVGARFPEKPRVEKKSFLNSPSPSLDLGQALGGLTRGAVGAAKSVPAVGDFVGEATAKTLYAINPENVVKELLNQSKEFASWWSSAATGQRQAFLEKVAAERKGGEKTAANPADKYFK